MASEPDNTSSHSSGSFKPSKSHKDRDLMKFLKGMKAELDSSINAINKRLENLETSSKENPIQQVSASRSITEIRKSLNGHRLQFNNFSRQCDNFSSDTQEFDELICRGNRILNSIRDCYNELSKASDPIDRPVILLERDQTLTTVQAKIDSFSFKSVIDDRVIGDNNDNVNEIVASLESQVAQVLWASHNDLMGGLSSPDAQTLKRIQKRVTNTLINICEKGREIVNYEIVKEKCEKMLENILLHSNSVKNTSNTSTHKPVLASFQADPELMREVNQGTSNFPTFHEEETTNLPLQPSHLRKKLAVPKFSGTGDFDLWLARFDALVHEDPRLSKSAKLMELLSVLEGNAKTQVEDVTAGRFAGVYYDSARSLLIQYYGGVDRRRQRYKLKFEEVKPLKTFNAHDIRAIHSKLEGICQAVDANCDQSINDPHSELCQMALAKLGPFVKDFSIWCVDKEKNISLASIREWLSKLLVSSTRVEMFSGTTPKQPKNFLTQSKPKVTPQRNRKEYSSTSNSSTDSDYSAKVFASTRTEWNCICCKSPEFHTLENCEKFKRSTSKEKFQIIKGNYSCLRCLKPTHTIKYCRNRSTCETCGSNAHHTLMHSDDLKKERKKRAKKNFIVLQNDSSSNSTSEELSSHSSGDTAEEKSASLITNKSVNSPQVSIAVASVMVHFGGKSKRVNALFDKGCNNTTITKSLMRELKMTPVGEEEKKTLNVMTGVKVQVSSIPVKFEISSVDNLKEFCKYHINARTKYEIVAHAIDSACPSLHPMDWSEVILKEPHLRGIKPCHTPPEEVQIVLGTDYAGLLTPLETRASPIDMSAPTAELTRLGWVLMGKNVSKQCNPISAHLSYRGDFHSEIQEDLNTLAEKFWETENPKRELSKWTSEESQGYEKMIITHDLEKKKFEATIPWKNQKPNLPYNREQVICRQKRSLHPNYLKRKNCSLEEIEGIVEDYLDKCYVHQLSVVSKDSFYLPFFPVVDRTRSTTQVRLVFDAAAKYDGISLNDAISNTPNLIQDSLSCLLAFRLRRYALIGDISQMFNRISLFPEDRKYHRFVMISKTGEVKDYEFMVQLFGNKAVPNISQKVLKTLVESHGQNFPLASNALLTRTYMDDISDSKDSEEELVQEIKELIELLAQASMQPRKWLSNSKLALSSVSPEERSTKIVDISFDTSIPSGKILGMGWDPNKDSFKFISKMIESSNDPSPWTRRRTLSTLFRQFDPLGLISPYLIRGKVLLQCMFISKLEWDQPISKELEKKWTSWVQESLLLESLQIPRYLGLGPNQVIEAHCFVDASVDAISCCFYMVSHGPQKPSSNLIFSKVKVTPIKSVSISRLELTAAHLGVTWWLRIHSCLEMKKEDITFWTDSKNVLYWVNNPAKHHKVYVAHRAGEIQEHTNPSQWRHVPTKLNPADIPSRGIKVEDLLDNSLFYKGPEFLLSPKDFWPSTSLEYGDPDDPSKEKRSNITQVSVLNNFGDKFLTFNLSVGPVWNGWKILLRRFSLLLVVKVCWIIFKSGQKDKSKHIFAEFLRSRNQLFRLSKWLLWKKAQVQDLITEIELLQDGKTLPPKHVLSKFCPFVDAFGLVRSHSRHEHSDLLPKDVRYPVILPTSHKITFLFVQHIHHNLKHPLGTNAMTSEVNKHCIIPGLYKLERRIRRACVQCVKDRATPPIPMMASLPSYRYSGSLRTFSNVGIDFTGSFSIKQSKITRSTRERPKKYVLVFSCLQTRAVHLEVTDGMNTQDVFEAISRFSGRRGVPDRIVSDNYSSFKSTNAELVKRFQNIDFDHLQKSTSYGYKNSEGIEWIYSPPSGSHFGGCFEIVVKAFKRAFYALFGRADMTSSEFRTAVVEVEGILNSRPLIQSKTGDIPVLTPSHFIFGQVGGHSLCPPMKAELSLYDRFKYLNQTLDHFWKRFMCEFLPELHPRRKWKQEGREISKGDLMILIDDKLSRGEWKCVTIQETFPGEDGRIRQVLIRTCDGTILRRPLSKLLPLEVEPLD